MSDNNFVSNFEDETDAGDTGELTLEQIDRLGQHPDLAALEAEFAATIQGLAWPVRRRLDELIGRAMLRGLEIGHAAGRLGVSVAMHF